VRDEVMLGDGDGDGDGECRVLERAGDPAGEVAAGSVPSRSVAIARKYSDTAHPPPAAEAMGPAAAVILFRRCGARTAESGRGKGGPVDGRRGLVGVCVSH